MIEKSIQRVLDGDTSAFRDIFKEYKDIAFSLANSVVKDDAIAKDIVQKAFLKAYRNLPEFNWEAKFSTWFCRIVVNESYNARKKQERFINKDFELSENYKAIPINDVLGKIKKDNQRYYVNVALSRLPPDYSLALRLFYLEEFSIAEIMEITGWNNSNTKVLLHRGRIKMKELLIKEFNQKKEDLY